jgi:peptide subunit release factor 1 (eRF1)
MDKDIDKMLTLLIEKEKIRKPKYKCLRCNFQWNPKKKDGKKPNACPKCKSYFYDKPSRRNIIDYLAKLTE